jgi:enoyl-CoA hydratase/carnithine racemase
VLAGNFLDASTAEAFGLLTHLVEPSQVEATVASIASAGKPENKYPGHPPSFENPTVAFATSFYSDRNMSSLMAGEAPVGFDVADKVVSRQLKSLSRAAPIALSMANDLLDAATVSDLKAGLERELEGLEGIFGTSDALEGLAALIEGRRPNYTNA